MLLDHYLPLWDITKENTAALNCSSSPSISILYSIDFSKSVIIKTLFLIRGLPSNTITIKKFIDVGFNLLQEGRDELVIGLIAQPWKPTGNLKRVSRLEFINFNEADFVKIGWNFRIDFDRIKQKLNVSTTTRVVSTSKGARIKFKIYWFVIGFFSGIIRREMLRIIKNHILISEEFDKGMNIK
ncbi:hypothetical protein [Paenibacillus glucanolyticus]|uniref:hypothetical protein n=1 Tax=Paenibacillus glucanolyticus TaxID=59843 RepID=UPI0034CE0575